MRFALYNIRYGTGGKDFRLPWSGYFRRTHSNLNQIIHFLHELDPDIIGLIEVDAGSYRSQKKNQAQLIADSLGHYHTYRSKYAENGVAQRVPILNKQGNAFITRDTIANERFHYFERGMKKLVIELELDHLVIFLVHLALSFRVRHQQLGHLHELVKDTEKPHIVAGDFNALWGGSRELELFRAATGLVKSGDGNPATFPSWSPRRELDFILHSRDIRTTGFWIPPVTLSDHLPLVCDFEVER